MDEFNRMMEEGERLIFGRLYDNLPCFIIVDDRLSQYEV